VSLGFVVSEQNADLWALPCGKRKGRPRLSTRVCADVTPRLFAADLQRCAAGVGDFAASSKASVQRSVRRESRDGSIERVLRRW